MKTILILSISEKRIVNLLKAKQAGYYIIVLDTAINDKCAPYIDEYLQVDINNKKTLLAHVDALYAKTKFTAVTTFLDKGVEPCAWVTQHLNLPGNPDSAAKATRNKYYMRQLLEKNAIPHAKFKFVESFSDLEAAANMIGYPLIFKPVGATLSKGIFKINSSSDLEESYNAMIELSNPNNDSNFLFYPKGYIAEEFMSGNEFSVEGVASRGEIYFAGITEKWTNSENFIETQHVFPARIDSDVNKMILNMAQQALHAINWQCGGFHIEVMLTPCGARIVEINGRLGGGYISSHLVEIATGIDLITEHYNAVFDCEIDLASKHNKASCISWVTATQEGCIERWEGKDQAEQSANVKTIMYEQDSGNMIFLPPKKFDSYRLAGVISVGENSDEAIMSAVNAKKLLHPIYAHM